MGVGEARRGGCPGLPFILEPELEMSLGDLTADASSAGSGRRPRPPVRPPAWPSLHCSFSFSLAQLLPLFLPNFSPSTALSLPLPSESSRIGFRPLVLLATPDSHCYSCSSLSVCLSVHV